MTASQIERFLSGEIKDIKKNAKKISPHFLFENIHALRVAVKRTRALLHLLQLNNNPSKIKFSKSFNHLYHISGFIREIQLEEKKLTEWNYKLPGYYRSLELENKHFERQWNEYFSTDLVIQQEEKILKNKFKTLSPLAVIIFYTTTLEILQGLYDKTPNNEEIHTFRKHLKDMLYISRIVKKNWFEAYKQIETFPLLQLKKLSDSIGEYNDEHIILDRLLQFKAPTQEEKEILKELCTSLKQKQQKDRRKLFTAMQHFITTANNWNAQPNSQ